MKAWYLMFFQTADGRGDWFAEIWWGDINRLNSLSFFFFFFAKRSVSYRVDHLSAVWGNVIYFWEISQLKNRTNPVTVAELLTPPTLWGNAGQEVDLRWLSIDFKANLKQHFGQVLNTKCTSGMFPSTGLGLNSHYPNPNCTVARLPLLNMSSHCYTSHALLYVIVKPSLQTTLGTWLSAPTYTGCARIPSSLRSVLQLCLFSPESQRTDSAQNSSRWYRKSGGETK